MTTVSSAQATRIQTLREHFESLPVDCLYSTSEISIATGLPDSTVRSHIRFFPAFAITIDNRMYWGNPAAVKKAGKKLNTDYDQNQGPKKAKTRGKTQTRKPGNQGSRRAAQDAAAS